MQAKSYCTLVFVTILSVIYFAISAVTLHAAIKRQLLEVNDALTTDQRTLAEIRNLLDEFDEHVSARGAELEKYQYPNELQGERVDDNGAMELFNQHKDTGMNIRKLHVR